MTCGFLPDGSWQSLTHIIFAFISGSRRDKSQNGKITCEIQQSRVAGGMVLSHPVAIGVFTSKVRGRVDEIRPTNCIINQTEIQNPHLELCLL